MPPSSQVARRSARAGSLSWQPSGVGRDGPITRTLVDVLARDIASGHLAPGVRLPSQRALARLLGVNLTTITRAMREAEQRGLVVGVIGSGTYVAARAAGGRDWASAPEGSPSAFVDLRLNHPPDAAEPDLAVALSRFGQTLARQPQLCRSLLPYRDTQGETPDRLAAARWLRAHGVTAEPSRIVITTGAQQGVVLALGVVARPGDAVLCEALVYPALRRVALSGGLRLVPVAMDAEGLRPDALREAIRRHTPAALVCTPTYQNPTGTTMTASRREALVRLLRRAGVWVIEDDLYAPLAEAPPPPLVQALPERTFHVTSLSKTVAPGLRVGYVVAPDQASMEGLLGGMRAATWMAPPLLTALASTWIRDGAAHRALRQIRRTLGQRHRVAARLLGAFGVDRTAGSRSPHLWVPLPDAATEAEVTARLLQRGVGVTAGTAFRVGPAAPHGIRLCGGAAPSVAVLTAALQVVREELHRAAGPIGEDRHA